MDKKICLVSSHGGHFKELANAIGEAKSTFTDYYWVTYKTKNTQDQLTNLRHYFVIDPVTSKIKFILNFFQSLWIIIRERPNVIISTGAGIAVFTILLGRFLLRAKVIYIESAANVTSPSKTGKFIYRYSDLFLVQWEELMLFYPKAKYVGLL